ncbi:neurogenic locus notch homolog protein 1 isoform X1 [Nematostella vectensis]|uniref:neurogenic locus notch homolog protein 1 isoform X1 n=1 Tax=Nematostella vectensis TaxID=45351 RepID=UPI0020776E3B|nr:neurogenic locus notch homolog protein 1 isoform X1 [Nematostella vectensis]
MKQKLWFLVIFLVYSSIQLADAGDKFFFNHTSLLQVSSATLPLNSRFDFRFRTCEGGVLLSQVGNLNNDFIEISVSKGIVNYTISVKPLYFTPSQLTVRWKVGGVENFVHVGNELDKSQYFTVRYVPGVGDANSTISLDGPITSYSASMPRDIRSFVSGGPLYAGGGSGGVWFSGCMESGTNVPFTLESKPTEPTPGCPLDSIAGCPNRKACDAGFTGDYCEINIDECASAPCHSYSTCLDGVNNYTCLCGPRWTGRDCSTNLGNLCDPNPCQNGGVCKETFDRNNYTCACPQGYTGWNCNGTLHPCETLNCTNGGTCQKQSNASDDYVCVCVTGFNCSEDINECESNPCRNNGTCRNEEGKFTCTCLSGFNGTFCEVNIDDCPAHGCNNGTCIDDINNYTCQCFIGFKGRHCEKDIDECRLGYCKNGATCTNTPGNYSCQCTEFTNGTNCQLDINECASSPCLNGALCQNNDCDKTACSDKGYECFCKSGFLGPLCEIDVDECFLAAVDPNKRCENGATCVDKVNRKECICPPGWTGDRCHVDIDECALGFCDNGATCNNFNGTYNCTCIPGYTDRNCSTDINECASNPCENGATCNDLINYFNCTCVPGYTGPLCETDVDECFLAAVDPNKRCENGATCVDKVNGKECICPLGWTGDRCHVYIGKCALGFCDNGATCNNFNGTYNCTCVPGYTDRNCSTDINECASNPCENGATCNDLINYFNCTCVPGYTGFNCSEDINECLSTPCQHSATCNDLVNDFSCNCTANYTGRQCEYLKTRCRPINPCLNGGRCIDIGFENFTCDCSAGFGGPLCENSTTVSLNGSSYLTFDGSQSEFMVALEFRTTLPDGVLVHDSESKFLLQLREGAIEISNGASSAAIEAALSDGNWSGIVGLNVTQSHLHLSINTSSVSIARINRKNPKLFIGGYLESLEKRRNLIGCIRDVKVNSVVKLPSEMELVRVSMGCPREEVCSPDPCTHGTCIDEWLTYRCACDRGPNCNTGLIATAEVNDQNSTIVGFAVLVAILFLVIFGLIVYIVVLKRAGLTTRKRRSEAENPGYSAFQNVAMQENVNQDQHTIPEMGDYEVAPSENREPIPDTIPQYESVNNAPARPPNNGNVTQYDVTQVSSVTQYEAMNSHPSLHQHVAANRQYDGVDSTRICGQNPPAMRARNGTGDHGEPGYENTRKRGLPPEVYQSLQATTQHSESAQYAPLNPLTRIGVRPCGRDERGVGLDIRESEYQELNQIEATDPCYQRVGSRVSSV